MTLIAGSHYWALQTFERTLHEHNLFPRFVRSRNVVFKFVRFRTSRRTTKGRVKFEFAIGGETANPAS
jgi:hypothetical protein